MRHPLIIAMLLLVAACGTSPRQPSADRGPGALTAAEQSYQSGRYREAERLFLALADQQPTNRDHWLLLAADAAWQAGFPFQAGDHLTQIDSERLDAEDAALSRLLSVLIFPERYTELNVLEMLEGPTALWPERYQEQLLLKKAQSFSRTGRHLDAARVLIERSDLLIEPEVAVVNRQMILEALTQTPSEQAELAMQGLSRDDPLFGWLKLIVEVKTRLFENGQIAPVVAQWQQQFPNHPANLEVVQTILQNYRLDDGLARRIAVLLPSSGRLATPSRAIRDGLLSAYFEQAERISSLTFYDSGSTDEQLIDAYQRAVTEGAEQIIGPLERREVNTLLSMARPEIPILALNFSDQPGLANWLHYQFGLSPEQEAAEMAERMLADGIFRAVLLIPESEFGQRQEAAFIDRFVTLGGHIIGRYRYPLKQNDYSDLLREVTGINEATSRYRRLAGIIGSAMEFEPRHRVDTDAVVMIANPEHGYLIRPQLAFHNLGDLPLYATSSIYKGYPDPRNDKDLDGIRLCDAPLVFELAAADRDGSIETPSLWSDTPLIRLFAVGQDAIRVLPYLRWLRGSGSESFPGHTGFLKVGPDGQVRRQLECGRIRNGRLISSSQ